MFLYFPTNYVWSASTSIAIESGAKMGEVDEICGPLREIATKGDDEGTQLWFERWCGMAAKLEAMGEEDLAGGRGLSAGAKFLRASMYYQTGERMQKRGWEPREAAYRKGIDLFLRGAQLAGDPVERVEIPYGNSVIAGYLRKVEGMTGPMPVVVHVNGLDSLKEMIYQAGLPKQLARRGVASFVMDQPGTGEALRLHGLTARRDAEHWASVVVDYLLTRADIDPARIGLHGVSLGGYYAPRAVAFEPRFALGVVWGANHNWGEMQRRRLAREGDRPVPHYWDHVQWVWGAKDMDDFMRIANEVHLNGILDRVRVPFLVTHGSKDRQIPAEYAQQTFDQLINSSKRELKFFTEREGGVQHSSIDNMANAGDYIADWIAEVFGGRLAA